MGFTKVLRCKVEKISSQLASSRNPIKLKTLELKTENHYLNLKRKIQGYKKTTRTKRISNEFIVLSTRYSGCIISTTNNAARYMKLGLSEIINSTKYGQFTSRPDINCVANEPNATQTPHPSINVESAQQLTPILRSPRRLAKTASEISDSDVS